MHPRGRSPRSGHGALQADWRSRHAGRTHSPYRRRRPPGGDRRAALRAARRPRGRARPRRQLPVRGDRRAQGRRLLRGARPGRSRRARRLVRARPRGGVEPPRARPGPRATRTDSGWRIDGRKLFCTMSPAATDLYVAITYGDEEGTERYAYAMVPTDAAGVVMNDDWDALGMRASGSNSVSLNGVELPESGVRGGFRAGDPLPYMERNLVSGLFHAAASLGIAESADQLARRGIAGRLNGDARPRMQVADNAVDLAAGRGVLSRAAALIDEHRAANPASDGSAEQLGALFAEAQAAKAFVNEAAARIVDRALALSGGAGYRGGSPLPRAYRDALGRFATGVAFITAAPHGQPAGLIVNSLTGVSLQPPLVSFSPARSSLTWARMRRAGRFGVNVLARHHEPYARRATPAGADRFAGLDWEPGRGGVPLLTDALTNLECEIVAEHPAGDHWIVLGRVDNLRTSPIKDPLVFFAGAFGA